MRTVVIESPYAPLEHASGERTTTEDHVAYARIAMLDCLQRGEAPYASHLLYTQVWDDRIPDLRPRGIDAGLALGEKLDAVVFYTDLGWSNGMKGALVHWARKKPIEYREIFPGVFLGEVIHRIRRNELLRRVGDPEAR